MAEIPQLEWEKQTWGKSPEDWQQAKAELRGMLVETARRRSVITYTEIAKGVRSVSIPTAGAALGGAVGLLLGQVNMEESRRLGKPFMLSVVAVNSQMEPSKGFRDLAALLKVPTTWEHWLPRVWTHYSSK